MELARDSRVGPDGMLTLLTDAPAWTALGDSGRLFRARNGEDSTERKRCLFCRLSDMSRLGPGLLPHDQNYQLL